MLASSKEWTPDAIRERQQVLADWALKRWAVSSPVVDTLVDEDVEIENEGSEEDEMFLNIAGQEDES